MKKCIFAALAAVCMTIGTSASAQQQTAQPQHRHPRHHRHGCVVIVGGENEQAVRECCREMSLDKKQTDRVCRESRRIARKHRKFADSYRRSCAQVRRILTPEQFGQWRKTMAPSEDMRMIHVDRPADTRNGNDYKGPKGPLCGKPQQCCEGDGCPAQAPAQPQR